MVCLGVDYYTYLFRKLGFVLHMYIQISFVFLLQNKSPVAVPEWAISTLLWQHFSKSGFILMATVMEEKCW